jgi:hypothetical protein
VSEPRPAHPPGPDGGVSRWEYKVIKVSVGTLTFQKYGPDAFPFEATLNEYGEAGWEAFHAQAIAENEALMVFLKRRRTAE